MSERLSFPPSRAESCAWIEMGDSDGCHDGYSTECGTEFCFNHGEQLDDTEAYYCPHCGGVIKLIEESPDGA